MNKKLSFWKTINSNNLFYFVEDGKMKIKIMPIILVILMLVSFFSGCFESNDNSTNDQNQKSKFIGIWAVIEPEDETYNTTWIFFENNSIKVAFDFQGQPSHYYGTYKVENSKLKVTSSVTTPSNATFDYTFSNGDNRLTLSNEDGEIVFDKTTEVDDNNDPVAGDDFATVDENSEDNQIDVLVNDQDSDVGDTLTVTGVGTPSHGTATYDANYVYYTPTACLLYTSPSPRD